MPSDLTAGLEYSYTISSSLKRWNVGIQSFTNQKVHVESAFLQNEWKTKMSFWLADVWINIIWLTMSYSAHHARIFVSIRRKTSISVQAIPVVSCPTGIWRRPGISVVGGEVALIRRAENLKEESLKASALRSIFIIVSKNGMQVISLWKVSIPTRVTYRIKDIERRTRQSDKERQNGSGATVMGLTLKARLSLLPGYPYR